MDKSEYCPNVTKVPVIDKEFNVTYELKPHKVLRNDRIVECVKCGTRWCCVECCVEKDSMDFEDFSMIYDSEEKPKKWEITCCKCSGNKPSWANDH